MKRLIMATVLVTMLASLGGCFFVERGDWGEGHERHGERHEERHEERR